MKQLLIVEDAENLTRLLALVLGAAGFEVECVAEAGRAAERLALDPLPHALLCDQNLEDSTGVALLSELRADVRTRALPTAVMSARLDEAERAAIAALDALALDKPLDMAQLPVELMKLIAARGEAA